MPESFADHFSVAAADYARFRPDYPAALFDWLRTTVRQHAVAWDCATGNGQAAVSLAAHFEHVVATDGSDAQLASATRNPRVHYACALAEEGALRSESVDLVTVAQALHWFDTARFYREVNRIVAPGGVIAVWSYGPMRLEPGIAEVVHELYSETLASWWPSERRLVDDGYRDIPFPFAPIVAPEYEMARRWTLRELLGYIGTWSAVQRYRRANDDGMMAAFGRRMSEEWGDPQVPREVRWPLIVRCGRVGSGES